MIRCPGCGNAMQRLTVDGVLGRQIDVDLCMQCRAFWFDPYETLHLTPASTLKIFSLIADKSGDARPSSFPNDCYCPKCGARLQLTHDRQRNTVFQYWRCDREHGRFTPFVDFLREKDFIRPLSPEQLAELRANVQVVNCSNCGAAIDLAHDSVCSHCVSPISVLDVKKMVELAKGVPSPQPSAQRVPQPATDEAHIHALLMSQSIRDSSSLNLIDEGLQAISGWLSNLLE